MGLSVPTEHSAPRIDEERTVVERVGRVGLGQSHDQRDAMVGGNGTGRSDQIAFGKVADAVTNVVAGEEQLRRDEEISSTTGRGVRRHIQLPQILLNLARMAWGLQAGES